MRLSLPIDAPLLSDCILIPIVPHPIRQHNTQKSNTVAQLYCTLLHVYFAPRYNVDMSNKQPVSYRLSPEAVAIIKSLAKGLGLSQAAVIEVAVRKLKQLEDAQTRINQMSEIERMEIG